MDINPGLFSSQFKQLAGSEIAMEYCGNAGLGQSGFPAQPYNYYKLTRLDRNSLNLLHEERYDSCLFANARFSLSIMCY